MEPLNTSTDQLDPAAISTRRRWSRSIAPLLLLASLLLSIGYWGFLFESLLVLAIVFLELSILCGILAHQRIFVCAVVATIAGIVGLGILVLIGYPPPPEPAAVSNLRTINTAEVTYLSSSGGRYGSIADLIAAALLDDTFTGIKAGYKYSVTLDAKGSVYTAEAVPTSTNTGGFGYYSHPDAVVRYSTNASRAPAGQSGRSVW